MQRVNQPDRISVDAFADTTTATNGQYYTFTNNAPTTALVGAKKVHMLRASIPYIQNPVPNYQLVFYYYKLANETDIPTANELHAIRFYPSDYVPPGAFANFTPALFWQNPSDLADSLNEAAGANGDDVTYNTLWVQDDVTFAYVPSENVITFQGNDINSYYCAAGYNDPIVLASQASLDIVTYNQDTTTSRQPYAPGWTLNLRLGFAMDGVNIPRGSGTNLVSVKCANLTGRPYAGTIGIYADTYPDLNYSSNVYVYSNIVGNSGYGSTGKRNLLGVIPLDVPLGGVAHYDGHSAPSYATKVASEIYSIDIELRDDASQPFYLPDSANVNIELNILYE